MASFQDLLVEQLPHLQRFARMLARDRRLADDLVQETAVRALSNTDKFIPGTNMRAWLSTILRNQFCNELRARSRESAYAKTPTPISHGGEQEWCVRMGEFERAFHALPATQQEALSLVAASGFSYEDAAKVMGCAEGTVKSRVCRARIELGRKLASGPIKKADERSARNAKLAA